MILNYGTKMSAGKRYLGPPSAHLEICRDVASARSYVCKRHTRAHGAQSMVGPWGIPRKGPDLYRACLKPTLKSK